MQAAVRAAGLIEIPPGSFVMGSARYPERFARVPMRITQAFYLEWVDWGEEAPTVHPPGQLKPNAFGLYDMAGNVHEFVRDRYAATASHYIAATHYTSANDFVSLDGEFTVTRAAAALDSPPALLSAAKTIAHPTRRKILAGFRISHVAGVTA